MIDLDQFGVWGFPQLLVPATILPSDHRRSRSLLQHNIDNRPPDYHPAPVSRLGRVHYVRFTHVDFHKTKNEARDGMKSLTRHQCYMYYKFDVLAKTCLKGR
jgi:hypothetical protein